MMRRLVLALLLSVALASPAWAAYTTATIAPIAAGAPTGGIKLNADGTVDRIEVIFTGNAGELPVTLAYVPRALDSTAEAIAARQWRDQQLATLNNKKTFAALPALQPGQVIPAAPVVTPPVLTAAQTLLGYLDRLEVLLRIKAALGGGAVAALDTDIAELRALVVYANDMYKEF